MAVRTVRHKVTKACWKSLPCRKRFKKQWQNRGQVFLYVQPMKTNPRMLWGVFRL